MCCSIHGIRISRRVSAVLAITAPIVLAFVMYPYWEGARSVRLVSVEKNLFMPKTMTHYRSVAIHSEHELQKLIQNVKDGMRTSFDDTGAKGGWLDFWCRDFETGVKAAGLDFTKESLILIPHTEGSGSIDVGLSWPWLRAKTLVCRIWRRVPSARTADMAYHCFALIVPNDKVAHVAVWVRGQHKETLSIEVKKAE
jgi:hypothetical protein